MVAALLLLTSACYTAKRALETMDPQYCYYTDYIVAYTK